MRLPLVMLIVLYLISILADLLIWLDLRHYVRRRLWSTIYACSGVVCWIFLTVVISLPKRDTDADIIPIMWMLYAYSTVYLGKIVYGICSLLGRIPQLWHGRRFNSGLWTGLPLGVLVFIVMWWGALEGRREIEVVDIPIVSPELPQAFDGYRIVQFSDAHVGTWGRDTTFIAALVDTINSCNPDLIVFTGDIVNRQTSELEPFLKVLSRLRARDGVYSVLGNHDYGDYITWERASDREINNTLLAAWQKQMGWRLLNNEHTYLRHGNDSIALIGVENWGEPPFRQYGRLSKAFPGATGLNDGRFKILLSHNPEHWRQEVSATTDIALTLSGHTHAMQFEVRIGSWRWSPAKYRYEQWAGLYEKPLDGGRKSRVYVNVGSGEVGVPFRIGATPEVTVITLKKAS